MSQSVFLDFAQEDTGMKNLRRMPIAILTALVVLGAATAWSADIKSSAADEQAHATAINAAVNRADNVKKAVADYRLHHDAFPASNVEAGLPPSAAFSSTAIKSIEVQKDGMITATLTAESGVDDGVIRFIPAMSSQTDQNAVEWTCTSPSYSNISDVTNSICTYSKNP
jgi:hypothetical protein